MDDNKVTLYITYKDGYAEVEIEQDGVRRKHDAKYANAEDKEPREFCAEVADKVEAELSVPAQWTFVNPEKPKKELSTPMKAVAIAGAFAVMIGLVMGGSALWSSYVNSETSKIESQQKAESERQKKEMMDDLKEELKAVQPTEVYLESNSSYTVCTGAVTNKTDKVHSFIQVKGEFMDANGNTIDTAWTYACGDEGLRPGESSKFTMSVAKDSRITNVRCYTYDFV